MRRLLICSICTFFLFHFALSQATITKEIFIKTDNGTWSDVLGLPVEYKKCPAILIIQGSRSTDKDDNSIIMSDKNNSLKQLSESPNYIGIATLRYDKTGMGMSKNIKTDEWNLVFDDHVNDANSFLDFLIDETLLAQLKANPYNLPKLFQEVEEITSSLKKGIQVTEVSAFLQNIYRPSIQPFMMSWMKYDPSEKKISKLKFGILIINGSTDLQVEIEDAQRLKASNDKASIGHYQWDESCA